MAAPHLAVTWLNTQMLKKRILGAKRSTPSAQTDKSISFLSHVNYRMLAILSIMNRKAFVYIIIQLN